MISRRDRLLIRPWELRKYENHCRKVRSALPAIDVGPPARRHHVACKLKKRQQETERCVEIERNNLRLLQSLRSIMTSSRVDNTWTTAQPGFLNRVKLFETAARALDTVDDPTPVSDSGTRKGRCNACNPRMTKQLSVPEERVPWTPAKPPVSRRSKSLPPRNVQIVEVVKDEPTKKAAVSKSIAGTPKRIKRGRRCPHKLPDVALCSPSIVLKRGDLQLALNFPPDTQVKLCNGPTERLIVRDSCQCAAIKAI